MILVRLRGGLGNQLFQYAAAKALSIHHQTELKLDLYSYIRHPYRKFELSKFQIDAREAGRDEVHRYTGSNPLIRYLNKRENYFRCPKVFAQPHYHFVEDFFTLPKDIYLSGYWQSEKYFSAIAGIIREQFRPAQAPDPVNVALKTQLESENSVSVHVRRSDYTSPGYQAFFGVLDKSYYESAMLKIKETCGPVTFCFFSDDLDWCRKNFGHMDAKFIDHNKGSNSYHDMLLMSYCHHHIIANSTFSWWGAWLNQKPGKMVIAPRQWFRTNYQDKKVPVYANRMYNTKDLIPPGWTTV